MSKEKILEATLELANEKGLGRVAMSQIAERAGLKKSSLYSHFHSKKEIIEEMYLYFREQSKTARGIGEVDYGALVEGHSFKEVLLMAVHSYQNMNKEPHLDMFYRVITTERAINETAAEIMVTETNTMIRATKQLFYAMQAKSVAHFANPDAAAFSFAMGVHAVIEFECDARLSKNKAADGMMEQYINEFCQVYEKKECELS